MQRISTSHALQVPEQQISSRIDSFFQHFKVGTLAHSCGIKKRPGRAKVLASVVVNMNNGSSARIVFVRNKRKKDWLALLSTDTNLSDADVVRIYGKRWDIEVFFRTIKQHLDLEKGCQARDFDALIAHTTIVMMRYLFLAWNKGETTIHVLSVCFSMPAAKKCATWITWSPFNES